MKKPKAVCVAGSILLAPIIWALIMIPTAAVVLFLGIHVPTSNHWPNWFVWAYFLVFVPACLFQLFKTGRWLVQEMLLSL